MSWIIYQVDAFSDRPFSGNPAGVCILECAAPENWMQAVAAEMSVAETAFLVRRDDGSYDLRWFTPTVEVDLCGHATLASAHVLWDERILPDDERVRFHTKSGELTAWREGDTIRMDFPSEPVAASESPAALTEALNVPFSFAGKNRLDWLVEVADEAAVQAASPELRALGEPGERLRLAVLRARGRCGRGPGDGIGALRPRPLLGGEAREGRAHRVPSLGARRHRLVHGRGRSCHLGWTRDHSAARQAALTLRAHEHLYQRQR